MSLFKKLFSHFQKKESVMSEIRAGAVREFLDKRGAGVAPVPATPAPATPVARERSVIEAGDVARALGRLHPKTFRVTVALSKNVVVVVQAGDEDDATEKVDAMTMQEVEKQGVEPELTESYVEAVDEV